MLLTSQTLRAVAWSAVALSTASAEYVLDHMSFGHKGETISPNLRGIPHWHTNGDGFVPHIMSDRVVLTPPWPGNAKGAVWSEEPMGYNEWTAELHFRVSGPERANGNLQLWYTKESHKENGPQELEKSSRFDGLVILIDQYAGHGGSIRGFLNDGTISFKDHHDPDTLAFGQCNYAYRNLGRLSVLKIHQTNGEFEVWIDGNTCFKTNKVHLPSGYFYGISASSAENPDSFEVHKFIASTPDPKAHLNEPHSDPYEAQKRQQQQQQHQDQTHHQQKPPAGKEPTLGEIPQMLSDVLAGTIRNQDDQFADLHNRIQIMSHRVQDIYEMVHALQQKIDDRHYEVINHVGPTHDRTDAALRNVEKIERIAMAIQRDLESKDYKDMITAVHNAVHDTHASLSYSLPRAMEGAVQTHGPKLITILFYFIVAQVVIFGGWQLYKKRRHGAPKKYL